MRIQQNLNELSARKYSSSICTIAVPAAAPPRQCDAKLMPHPRTFEAAGFSDCCGAGEQRANWEEAGPNSWAVHSIESERFSVNSRVHTGFDYGLI
jgi:hypothetical protein